MAASCVSTFRDVALTGALVRSGDCAQDSDSRVVLDDEDGVFSDWESVTVGGSDVEEHADHGHDDSGAGSAGAAFWTARLLSHDELLFPEEVEDSARRCLRLRHLVAYSQHEMGKDPAMFTRVHAMSEVAVLSLVLGLRFDASVFVARDDARSDVAWAAAAAIYYTAARFVLACVRDEDTVPLVRELQGIYPDTALAFRLLERAITCLNRGLCSQDWMWPPVEDTWLWCRRNDNLGFFSDAFAQVCCQSLVCGVSAGTFSEYVECEAISLLCRRELIVESLVADTHPLTPHCE